MHYETTFGIFDHRTQVLQGKRPFSSQAYHQGVDPGPSYAFTILLKSYLDNQVKEFLQMPFDVYCTLSHSQMNELHETLGIYRKRKVEDDETAAREQERKLLALANAGKMPQPSPGVNARAMFDQR